MNGVKFIKQNGGLGRVLANTTHISGLIVYGETAVEKQVVTSVKQLEELAITATSNPVLHYHVSEFFRINEGAKLYLESVLASDGNYTELKVLQSFAQGSIRQFAVCDFKTAISELATSVGKLDEIAKELWELNTPVNVVYSAKVVAADIVTLPDLHTLDAENVSVVLGQDGSGRGAYLVDTTPSISCIGAVLGAVSKAQVHESIAWVERQNMVTKYPYDKELTGNNLVARELDVSGLCDGSKIGDYTPAQLETLDEKGYLFGIKHTGITGTYLNDSYTATSLTSDFTYIENGRTISEAVRNVNRVLVPKISSPMYVNPDTGLLDEVSVSSLEAICEEQLDQMQRKGQISGYKVSINPNQSVLSTSKLVVVLKIIPVGTLREIEVQIGLTLKKD